VKTISIKKRIALGTVVAVAAGLLTTVAASTANAAATLWSDGVNQRVDWLSNDASGAPSLGVSSVGLVGTAFTAQTGSAAASGVILASGRLAINVQIANSVARDTYVVSGGQIIGSAAVNPTGNTTNGTVVTTVNTDGSKLDVNETVAATGTPITLGGAQLLIAPTVAAGGTISITRYTGVASQYAANSNPTFKAAVSVAASSVAGTVSTTKSFVYLNSPVAAGGTSAGVQTYDAADGFTVANGQSAPLRFSALDAYGVAATGGPLTYSSDNCVVGLNGTYSTVKSNYDAVTTSGIIYASQAVANTATTCVVTISWSGTVLGTKTVKFLGDIASLTATSGGIQSTTDTAGNRTASLLSVVAKDAAGNVVPAADAVIDSGSNAYVTTLDNTGYTASTLARAVLGKGESTAWTCGGLTGSASIVLKVTNAAGATIKSAPVTLACGANADSYTIATDASSYAAGSIATITVTFKAADGSVPNDVSGVSAVGKVPTVSSGAFNGLVTTPTSADTSTNGVLKYKAVIGQTAGTFPVVVDVPAVDAAHGAVQTATITVTSTATDSVSQLVKVVGTLLTSFTKQISALIKALSKKK